MAHVGAALKTHLVNSVKSTWNTVYQLAMFSRLNSNNSLEYKPRIVSLYNTFCYLCNIIPSVLVICDIIRIYNTYIDNNKNKKTVYLC